MASTIRYPLLSLRERERDGDMLKATLLFHFYTCRWVLIIGTKCHFYKILQNVGARRLLVL